MKANPGYKWCPTTSKPVKSPSSQSVSNPRKKVWSSPPHSNKDATTAKKVSKTENMPQLNFAMAGQLNQGQEIKLFVVKFQLPFICLLFSSFSPSPSLFSSSYLCSDFADPTKMGGLSMLLLAGEHALTNKEVDNKLVFITTSCDLTESFGSMTRLMFFVFSAVDPLQH